MACSPPHRKRLAAPLVKAQFSDGIPPEKGYRIKFYSHRDRCVTMAKVQRLSCRGHSKESVDSAALANTTPWERERQKKTVISARPILLGDRR